MASKRMYLPMGGGGLIRYGEEEKSYIMLKPTHIVYIAIALILLEVLLHYIL